MNSKYDLCDGYNYEKMLKNVLRESEFAFNVLLPPDFWYVVAKESQGRRSC